MLDLWKRGDAAPSVTDNIAALRRRLTRDRQLFLLAWDGPVLVGSIMGGWDGWRASIARLTVEPKYRRRGLASLLVSRVEKEFRKLGVKRVSCVVLRKNRRARLFWAGSGYRRDSDAVRYRRDLP